MTNITQKRLKKLYQAARKERGSQYAYNYYVNQLRRMGLTSVEYEQAVRKLAEVLGL